MKMLKYLIGSLLALPVANAQSVLANPLLDFVLVLLFGLVIFFLIKSMLKTK